jgi:uncharacterized membrane protein YdbT with pleckstrin-like domain
VGYIDKHLGPEEQVVFRTRLHPVVFAGTVGFAAFVAAATALIILRNDLSRQTVGLLCLSAAGAVVVSFVSPFVRWRTSEFAVTTSRVLVKMGLVSVHTIELLLPKVEAIAVDQTLGGRLFGYGTLRIVGTGGTVEAFPRVARPEGLREAVLQGAPRSAAVRRR